MKKLAIMALALMMIVGSFSACGDAKKSDKGSAENGTKFIMLIYMSSWRTVKFLKLQRNMIWMKV